MLLLLCYNVITAVIVINIFIAIFIVVKLKEKCTINSSDNVWESAI